MNQKALKTLEYTKIITQLESHAASPLGKSLCRELSPSSDLEEIRTRQAQTTDAVNRVRLKGSVSFSGLREIGGSLKRLEIGSSLSIPELLSISSVLTVASRAKAYGRRDTEAPPFSPPVFPDRSRRSRLKWLNMCLTPWIPYFSPSSL